MKFSHNYAALLCGLAGFVLVVFSGCFSSGEKKPSNEDIERGSLATVRWFDENYGIIDDRSVNKMLSRMVARLSHAVYGAALEADIPRETATDFQNKHWQIFVLNIQEAAAVSTAGGIIFISKGLIQRARSEAELAAVIAHEMGHEILGHTYADFNESWRSETGPQFIFSLENEIMADRASIKVLKVARYDIREAVFALTKMYRHTETEISPDWLRARQSALYSAIEEVGNFLPATKNTREFVRVRNGLTAIN